MTNLDQAVTNSSEGLAEVQKPTPTLVKTAITLKISNLDLALLSLRLVAGLIFTLHGSQLLFGAFNGPGLAGTLSEYGPGGGGLMGLLVAIGEFFGGLGLIVGLLSRFSAAINILIMVGAIYLVHGQNGFFMLGPGYKYVGGFEYNLALLGLCLPLVITGPGRLALSHLLFLSRLKNSRGFKFFLE
jgi:putative oxidoreductase